MGVKQEEKINNLATSTSEMERWLGYSQRSEDWKSNSIGKLSLALAKAQGDIKGALSKSKNPFFNSKYADLHTVLESCLPHLTKCGLAIIQGNEFCDKTNGFYVTTMMVHSSGEWIRSRIRMPIGKNPTAHSVGSATTYGRRYGLSAMVGIAQYDDDGNDISINNNTNQ